MAVKEKIYKFLGTTTSTGRSNVPYFVFHQFDFQDNKPWFLSAYPNHGNNVIHCKNTLLTWLMIVLLPTLKYT